MDNLYWPVYKNLEQVVDDLSFAIHIDDKQLDVYSSRITDIILRAATEIESISKELYISNGGTKASNNIKFDDDAIKHLKNLWKLDLKKVIISSPNCFQTDRVLTPFVKNETRTSSTRNRQTYSWNNAYQNLKHDRARSLSFGSLRYLFDIMAALYVLNIYYKNEKYELGKDSKGLTFPLNLGSNLFSVKLAVGTSHDSEGKYIKPVEFEQSIYYIDWTQQSGKIFQESAQAFQVKILELLSKHPKFIKYISENDVTNDKGNLAWNILGQSEYIALHKQALAAAPIKADQIEYEAVLNVNDV